MFRNLFPSHRGLMGTCVLRSTPPQRSKQHRAGSFLSSQPAHSPLFHKAIGLCSGEHPFSTFVRHPGIVQLILGLRIRPNQRAVLVAASLGLVHQATPCFQEERVSCRQVRRNIHLFSGRPTQPATEAWGAHHPSNFPSHPALACTHDTFISCPQGSHATGARRMGNGPTSKMKEGARASNDLSSAARS